ncbi:hypothetical protein AB4242_01545 [Vibrio splendidus]|jgi:hypothetical protein|uniref:Uncharacterized protein n=1 Tax=Vibrio splendidus TaxID=29497 RepID=A0ABD5A797_VIBSP|nr:MULTISPECIES: hypothetical protein [Vibrio]MCC4882014.1 hypothetical protein [Vibrio splendidus]MDH6025638.1 hypothetical protein [Vibrio splendidus]MDP2488828.1 hypothetical protein [Vibrio splendidus]OCH63158.1 hypothetical protein A6D94_15175 [Vibrio splendidus]OED76815.1 hypothetical protein A144_05025 [Vibrio splendidus ZF-90]
MIWNLNLPSTGPHLFLALGATIIFVVDYHVPLGIAMAVPYVTIVLLAATTKDPTSTVMWAITCTLLTLIGYYLSSTGSETWFVAFNRVITIYAIWVSALVPMYITLQSLRSAQESDLDNPEEKTLRPHHNTNEKNTFRTFKN